MGYREVGLMDLAEIVRRWQAGESARAIAQGTGLARDTVGNYLREARQLGPSPAGLPPADHQLLVLAGLGQTASEARAVPKPCGFEPHGEQIAQWLQEEKLQLTRVAELLDQRGAPIKYTTLRRYAQSEGAGGRSALYSAHGGHRRGGGVRLRSPGPAS